MCSRLNRCAARPDRPASCVERAWPASPPANPALRALTFITVCAQMPQRGHAWDKPNVNMEHKMAVRKKAQAIADKSAETRDALRESLRALIEEDADFPSARRDLAFRAVEEAVRRLARNEDPLAALKPPQKCGPCSLGQTGGTHHFLCESRKQQLAEPRVRDALL